MMGLVGFSASMLPFFFIPHISFRVEDEGAKEEKQFFFSRLSRIKTPKEEKASLIVIA